MKVAVIQFNATADKEKNVLRALRYVQEAVTKGAEFILLPEMFNFRGKADPQGGYEHVSERIPGPSLKPFFSEARKNKIHILAGSICEKIPGKKEAANTSVLIDARGMIAARYRKMHLFDARIGKKKTSESFLFLPGKKAVMANVGAWTVGLSICYDLRFPELFRAYAKKGAHVLCVPSAFTKITGQAHWEILLRARAIENLCYVLAPNQTGKDGKGIASYGNSMIIDPWGNVLAKASSDREEIIYAKLDQKVLTKKKKILGV